MSEQFVFNILLFSWFVLSLVVFVSLFFISAPYGRYTRKGWGFSVNNRLSWIIMESPAVIVFLFLFIIGSNKLALTAIVFMLMWEVHYIQRAFIYPFSLSSERPGMPVSVIVFGFIFNGINSYLNGRYLFTMADSYQMSWLSDPRFILGFILFVIGYILNRDSDKILSRIRKEFQDGYRIINKGWFNLISSPNYLGEILIWIGWAIATWSITGLAFALWTIANLVPRAQAHHNWYKKYFSDYPAERRALIPKLW